MFASTAPSGGRYLTLNLLPQSVLEGAFALALVVLLAVPLVARIHRLLEDAPKDSRDVRGIADDRSPGMHGLDAIPSDTSLRFDLHESEAKDAEKMRRAESRDDDARVFDYRAYRHRLMEEVLMKYYAERQPPGQVVMNSIHLNAQDDSNFHSKGRDLFGFIDDVDEPSGRKNASYVHPLDHFLVKGPQRATTEEKSIETRSPSLWSIPDMISDARLSSVKNEGELVVSLPRTSQHHRNHLETLTRADHHGRYEAEERPKTVASRLPTKPLESKGQQKPHYRMQPAEILRIDREDCSSRPLTAGESSSDLGSSLYDTVDSRRRRGRGDDPKNLKRPWLVSSHPESYNRKYGKQLRESLFDARWRLRQSSPRQSNATAANCSSTASLLSAVSRSPSPSSDSRAPAPPTCQQKGSEVLQKVTLLSSSLEQSDRRERSKLGLPEAQEGNEFSKSQAPAASVASIASSPGTPRRRVSRLPLHINSKKPIASKLSPSETEGRAKSEDQRPQAISSSSERPKTTSGAVGRTAASKPRKLAVSGEKRPKTSDYSAEAPKTQKPEDEAGKKPVSWSVTLATKSIKRKPRSSANGNESDASRKDDPSAQRARPRARSSRKNAGRGAGENARVKVAVNRGLKTYIEKLKIVLSEQQQQQQQNRGRAQVESAELAGLSLVEAVTAEIEANLSAGEIHELRDILQSAERKITLGTTSKC
ncbi:serine/arginine repetitive matrix protein 2-like isoform X1 [Nasonia vitripennis]|uniref:Uncharacterized protein n=2 Tax=Nasonia vitripennis TaxID=7425 RepID=A0A7M7H9D2_NASVI|nr:serine/arginine repetitive matrix protein 2-like isoform X1 [Nasonia vitripennis]